MKMERIDINEFDTRIFDLWAKKWLLLTSGDHDKKDYNCMTVAWGSIGIMWNRPFVQVVVRPTRHTDIYMKKYDTFTVTAFSQEHRDKLKYLGTVSGRDENKIEISQLTLVKSEMVQCPSFAEAELSIECRKIYYSKFFPEEFLDKDIEKSYPEKDYHNVYYGEILSIKGVDSYRKAKDECTE